MKPYKMLDITAILLVAGFLTYAGVVFLKPNTVLSDTEMMPVSPELTQASGQSQADYGQSPTANSSQLADTAGSDFPDPPFISPEPAVESDFYISSSHAHLTDEARQSLPALTAPDRNPSGSSSSRSSATTSTSSSSGSSLSGGSSGSGGGGGGGTSPTTTESNKKPRTGNGAGGIPSTEVQMQPEGIAAIFLRMEELASGRRPLLLSAVMDNLLKYDAFWSAETIARLHPEAWRTLRTQQPGRLALFYITPVLARPDVQMPSYLDYEYINQYHPEWFLLKDETNAEIRDYQNPRKRMQWNPDDPRAFFHSFMLDVGNPQFQNWAVAEFLKKLETMTGVNARIRYSGIGADTVMLTTFHKDKTTLYPNWKYASGGWNQAYFSYLGKLHEALKSRGYLLIVNQTLDYSSDQDGSDWQDLMAVVDGVMDEEAMMMSSTNCFGGDQWEWSMKHHEEILEKGLYDWWECNFHDYKDPMQEYHNFLYVYCSFLLAKNTGRSLFGVHRRMDEIDLNSWYEEYNLPLGNPVGVRYQKDDCWLRDYQYGKVIVNPSKTTICTIYLDSDSYTLDWSTKKRISRLTLEPMSATILLPTGYPVD